MKLNILYTINKRKINKKGVCSILCRMTYSKNRKTFSTGLFINPKHWNSKKQIETLFLFKRKAAEKTQPLYYELITYI